MTTKLTTAAPVTNNAALGFLTNPTSCRTLFMLPLFRLSFSSSLGSDKHVVLFLPSCFFFLQRFHSFFFALIVLCTLCVSTLAFAWLNLKSFNPLHHFIIALLLSYANFIFHERLCVCKSGAQNQIFLISHSSSRLCCSSLCSITLDNCQINITRTHWRTQVEGFTLLTA